MITLSLTEDELLVLAVALATRSKHLDTWIGGRVSIDTDTRTMSPEEEAPSSPASSSASPSSNCGGRES